MEDLPEEIDVSGFANNVEHLVVGRGGGMREERIGMGVEEQAVDRTPGVGE
ncbi:hypothetical protein HS088_TW02G01081 [Tripterygium wilfordii]|uniref:Uncharacterized protein n=1 Tax=Tripterygium wilfordii TaxID=458696 RepID=A0A7J7E0K8_TRIWF|nr:hypothetical protein HS088_TW02G01081 [Tripterygium wilfordii]